MKFKPGDQVKVLPTTHPNLFHLVGKVFIVDRYENGPDGQEYVHFNPEYLGGWLDSRFGYADEMRVACTPAPVPATAGVKLAPRKCTCSMNTLMSIGCKCGGA